MCSEGISGNQEVSILALVQDFIISYLTQYSTFTQPCSTPNADSVLKTPKKCFSFQNQNRNRYWEKAKEDTNKTPLVKENTVHDCKLLPPSTKIRLIFLCLFNYADTVTDLVTMVGMFQDGNKVLGSVSLVVMLLVGWSVPKQIRSLQPHQSRGRRMYTRKWSWKDILALLTFSSTQHFIWKHFLRNHQAGTFDRRNCQTYDSTSCRTSKCNNIKHKMILLQKAISREKMLENQSQLILQLINIAPDFFSTSAKLGLSNGGSFWHYWKLVSLILTILSLPITCVRADFLKHELFHCLFNFYSYGQGWKAFYPQKFILFVVHSTAIASKVFTVVFIIMLVNHDFSQEVKAGSCSLPTALDVIVRKSETSCYFQTKVAWLLFLYVLVYICGCLGLLRLSVHLFAVRDSVKLSLRKIGSLRIRVKNIMIFVYFLLLESFVRFPVHAVLRQRLFMMTFLNHLQGVRNITFTYKILPSLLQSTVTVIFTIMIYMRDGNFTCVDIGMSPFHFAIIGILMETVHLTSLVILVYWADPQHVKSLSDEKTLEALIRMGKVDETVDVSCSKSADEIIRQAIWEDCNFNIFKEDIQRNIIDSKTKHRPRTKQFGDMEILTLSTALQYRGFKKVQYRQLSERLTRGGISALEIDEETGTSLNF